MADRAGPRELLHAGGLALAAGALWGTTGTAQALGPTTSQPQAVGALRIAIGAIALLGITLAAGCARDLLRMGSPDARLAALVGVVAVAAYQLCFFSAVRMVGVALGTLVAIGSAPIVTGLLSILLGRRPNRRWTVAAALAIAGCAILVLPGRTSAVQPAGIALALGAGTSYACFALASKRLLEGGLGGPAVMAAIFGGGALLLLPTLLGADLHWLAAPSGAATVLWLGLVATAAAYLLFAAAMRRLPAANVATLSLAEPLTASLLGVAVLHERLPGIAFAGAFLLAVGLLLISLPERGIAPALTPTEITR